MRSDYLFKKPVRSEYNRNEYQESFLGMEKVGAYGWHTYHLHVPIV